MFAAEEPSRIGKIWETHHNDQPDSAGACCDAAEHDLLVERGRESPLFVFPLRRDGGHLMLLSQFDPKHAMWVMCYLEDYKRNPELAPPWLSAQLFPDLERSPSARCTHVDPDGDLITIADDRDVQEAVSIAMSEHKSLAITRSLR